MSKKREYTIQEIAKMAEVTVETIVDSIRNDERSRTKIFQTQKNSKAAETEYLEMLVRGYEAKKVLGMIDKENMDLLHNIIQEVTMMLNTHEEEEKVSKPAQKIIEAKIVKIYTYFNMELPKETEPQVKDGGDIDPGALNSTMKVEQGGKKDGSEDK